MITQEAIEKIFGYGANSVAPQVVDTGARTVLLGRNAAVDISEHYPPKRVKRAVALIDAGSFADYVNRFKNPDTLIFATVEENGAKLTAILDYHGAPTSAGDKAQDAQSGKDSFRPRPEYCSHIATLELQTTDDWDEWTAADREPKTQVGFAEWLEEHAYLFNRVEEGVLRGAELLELVSTLIGKSEVRFNSQIRLKDGKNSLAYEEDVGMQGQLNNSTIDFPSVINAGMHIFTTNDPTAKPYQVDARLKTRIEGRKLAIWFETINRNKLVRDAVLNTVRDVATATGIIPLIGTP